MLRINITCNKSYFLRKIMMELCYIMCVLISENCKWIKVRGHLDIIRNHTKFHFLCDIHKEIQWKASHSSAVYNIHSGTFTCNIYVL